MNRLDALVNPPANGVPKPARRPPKAKPAPAVPAAPAPARPDHLYRYAVAGVAVMSALSAGLNGHANALGATVPLAGWLLGLTIPAVILLLGKVAGVLWRRGRRPLAYATAGAGVGLLALSVWHCATSIALLTGSPLLLALPMAVAIDVGFVCCELAALED